MTSNSRTPALSRRSLFAGAATVGVAAAATAVLPQALAPAAPAAAQALPKPEKGGGYSLSAHVQRYYSTTRI